MEYTIKVTICPTVREATYAARVFISGDDGTKHVDTEQIWECSLLALDPSDRANALIWAMSLLNEMVGKLGPDAILGQIAGQGKLMDELFTHQGLYLS